jgi:hypothetical protein
LLGRLARLQLAAGKLPKAGERLTLWPLADQHAAIAVDQGGGDNELDRLLRRIARHDR